MQSLSLAPIAFTGDPTQRGLAKLPTLFTANDVSQGFTDDSPLGITLVAAGARVQSNTGQSSGSASFTGNGEIPGATPPLVGGSGGGTIGDIVTSVLGNGSSDTTSSGDSSDCSNMSILHPIDALVCILDRFLFGLVALVLIVLGIWMFAKGRD